MNKIITIDGLAGVGKSTLTTGLKKILEEKGYSVKTISTGRLYRLLTLFIYRNFKQEIDWDNKQKIHILAEILERLDFTFEDEYFKINGMFYDHNDLLTVNQVLLGQVSKNEEIRDVANEIFKNTLNNLNKDNIVILEGRDSGSVVAPNADLKIFLRADEKQTYLRRIEQLDRDIDNISLRNSNDITQTIKPKDSIEIDTVKNGIIETLNIVINALNNL